MKYLILKTSFRDFYINSFPWFREVSNMNVIKYQEKVILQKQGPIKIMKLLINVSILL